MERFNRILLNILYIGIFFSTFAIMFIFKAGNDLSNVYDRLEKEKQETIMKNPNPSDCEIVGKTDDGEYLQFVLWDSQTQKEHKIHVHPSDYDLYKIGDIYYTDKDTIN